MTLNISKRLKQQLYDDLYFSSNVNYISFSIVFNFCWQSNKYIHKSRFCFKDNNYATNPRRDAFKIKKRL